MSAENPSETARTIRWRDKRTETPGVYSRADHFRVLLRRDGRKVMHRFATYEEARAFKLAESSQRGRGCGHYRPERDPETTHLRSDPCAYCGEPADTHDHIVWNGADDWTNLTAACRSCNTSKGRKSLLLFLAHTNGCFEWRRDRDTAIRFQ